MPDFLHRHGALRVIMLRALITTIVVSLLLGIAGALAEAPIANPIGIVILVSVVGTLDFRRRAEQSLWGNLGYATWVHPLIHGSVALLGVVAFTIIRLSAR